MALSVPNPAALLELAGTDLGTTEWITVGQQRIIVFHLRIHLIKIIN